MDSASAADPIWQAAAEALRAAGAGARSVWAPMGFTAYFPSAQEYQHTANLYRVAGNEAEWLVVNQDHLNSLPLAGLAALLVDSRLIFANEVFGVFALTSPQRPRDPSSAALVARLAACKTQSDGEVFDPRSRTDGSAPQARPTSGPQQRGGKRDWRRRLVRALAGGSAMKLPMVFKGMIIDKPPSLADPISQACTQAQFDTPVYRHWCEEIREAPRYHRKQWEFCYILQALSIAGTLYPGRRGLGYGVGTEPLTAVFAARGCQVLATDLDRGEAQRAGWVDTNQHASELSALNARGICDPVQFAKSVAFRFVDMNAIHGDLVDFDFTWSACCLEHLGSIDHGLAFIENSLRTLRPGGIAVHTTEFNCSSNRTTIDHAGTVLFRKRDILALAGRLAADGHRARFTFNLGDQPLDRHVDVAPYSADRHLKLRIAQYATTSFGLIIRKKD